jgi:hypothetical protein
LSVVLASVCLSACAVPISPGYKVLKESREIRFVPGSPPAVEIHSVYSLTNSGATDLNFIDLNLPTSSIYGRVDASAKIDGHSVALQEMPAELQFDFPDALRLPFASTWKMKQAHGVEIDYALRSPSETGSRITLNDADFHLGSRGAFPVLEPPKHLLAPFPKRPKEMFYTVRVPADFRILARGTLAGRKQLGSEVEYRYRLNADDLGIYVVGGRYTETTPSGNDGPIFWTYQPVSIDPSIARQISESWETLQKDFGPLDKNNREPHIVEVTSLPEHISGENALAAVAFPGGALVNSAALAKNVPADALVEAISHALAHNWLGDQIYPAATASLVLGEGLPEYAMIVIDEARGGEAARRRRIQRYLAAYDSSIAQGEEQTLAVSTIHDPPTSRRIALAKTPLFFAALEDECGQGQMREAVKEVVTLFRGQEVNYPDLRVALENHSGKSLAPMFRLWLNQKGIPRDFRARYAPNAGSGAR